MFCIGPLTSDNSICRQCKDAHVLQATQQLIQPEQVHVVLDSALPKINLLEPFWRKTPFFASTSRARDPADGGTGKPLTR